MTQVIVGDFRTGRRWQNVPYKTCKWEQRRNAPETLSVTIPMADREVQKLNLRNTATEGKSYLGIIEDGDVIPAAGPMLKPDYDQDTKTLTLSAFGFLSGLESRFVLPPVAYTINPAMFIIPDPLDPTGTVPNPAVATNFANLSFGSIIRGLVAQAVSIPGGDLPIVLPPVAAGIHTKNYDGIDLKGVWDAISDITKLQGGPDVVATARWMASRQGLEWVLRTGTDAQPVLRSETVHRWDLSVEQKSTRGLKVQGDASTMASVAWFTGGESADVALLERVSDSFLLDFGFPLRELADSSHSDVVERPTLTRYARAAVESGRRSSRFWAFQVRKDRRPFFGQYGIGDLCELVVRNDPYIPDGTYVREIAGLSGDQGTWITVTTSEAFDG